MFKRIQRIYIKYVIYLSADKYVKYLKRGGVKIGKNFHIYGNLRSVKIDMTRPSLVEIGDNVGINANFTLLTHDYVTAVFKTKYHDFINSSGKVKIGNNTNFGINCTVLKGVTIGDNCFIAAGSLVTKDIPSDSIAAGVPAKVICSMDDYYAKRKIICEAEAFEYARSIVERWGRKPVISDFWEEFHFFVDKNNIKKYESLLPIKNQLGSAYDYWIENHKAKYKTFEEFLEAAEICVE